MLRAAGDLHNDAQRAGEAALAATLTVARRQEMMAAALTDPRQLAHPEFTRMVTEKIGASAEAAMAALTHAHHPSRHVDRWLQTQGEIALLACQGLSKAATPGGALSLWTSLTQRSVEASFVLAEAIAGVGASLLRAGFDPFHRAVTANARRLNGGGGRRAR